MLSRFKTALSLGQNLRAAFHFSRALHCSPFLNDPRKKTSEEKEKEKEEATKVPPPSMQRMKPETLCMTYGYVPEWSENALKPPLFQTSTFVFKCAEDGKNFFEIAYGLKQQDPSKEEPGLIYSRINNPDLEILENRVDLWDKAGQAAVFSSGMAAISTSLLTFLFPGESMCFSRPVYGGTDLLLEAVLPARGITTKNFLAGTSPADVDKMVKKLNKEGKPCKVIFVETPANPTMIMTDIEGMAKVAHDNGALLFVDNTFMGPVFQSPIALGADVVLYSATKYLGGHSDLVAGVAVGRNDILKDIKMTRSVLGCMVDPHTAWLLMRSLETLKLRMERSAATAEILANWIAKHPMVERVVYPSMFTGEQKKIYERQCKGSGGMLTFYLKDKSEEAAFRVLNHVKLIKLAVSLGGTESLIEHPVTMTHSDIPKAEQEGLGLDSSLIRLSVGVEDPEDLKAALAFALEHADPSFLSDEPSKPAYLETFFPKKK